MATLLTADQSAVALRRPAPRWGESYDSVRTGQDVVRLGTPGAGVVRGPIAVLDQELTDLGRLVAEVASGESPIALGLGAASTAVLDAGSVRVLSGRIYLVRPSLSGARVVVVETGGVVDVEVGPAPASTRPATAPTC